MGLAEQSNKKGDNLIRVRRNQIKPVAPSKQGGLTGMDSANSTLHRNSSVGIAKNFKSTGSKYAVNFNEQADYSPRDNHEYAVNPSRPITE